jgi:hypothetical protein
MSKPTLLPANDQKGLTSIFAPRTLVGRIVATWEAALLSERCSQAGSTVAVHEVPGSNLVPETGRLDRYFSWFSTVPLGQFWVSTYNWLLSLLFQVETKLMVRPTVSRPVCFGIKHPSGA